MERVEEQTPVAILRVKDLQRLLSLSRSTILSRVKSGDFPEPITLGPRAVGWLKADIDSWLESRTRRAPPQAVRP